MTRATWAGATCHGDASVPLNLARRRIITRNSKTQTLGVLPHECRTLRDRGLPYRTSNVAGTGRETSHGRLTGNAALPRLTGRRRRVTWRPVTYASHWAPGSADNFRTSSRREL